MGLVDVKKIKAADLQHKPGGSSYDTDGMKLAELFEDRSRELTYAYLKDRGLGRPHDEMPLEVPMVRRVIEALSVVYRTPPTRSLVHGDDELPEDGPEQVALDKVLERAQYDLHWEQIDALRNLYRQVAVSFAEGADGSVSLRVFEPFNLFRKPSSAAADTLELDEVFLLQTRHCRGEPEGNRYEAWLHEDSGLWRMWIVDENGNIATDCEQPYGEEGLLPWGAELPVVLIYDELPRGRAYLPIPQSRVAFALGVNALLNELAHLVAMEAHTNIHVATDDPRDLPTETGTGKVWRTPADGKIGMLATNPKIKEVGEVIDQMLRFWSTGESLPGDEFRSDKVIATGEALRVRERELHARRQRQIPLAHEDERKAFRKLRAVHNVFARDWDLPELDEEAELEITIGRPWQPATPEELQARYMKDMAVGAASLIDYAQELYGCNRSRARRILQRVGRDRREFPAGMAMNGEQPLQNPGALVDGDGPRAAMGPGSATKVPGAFNPDLGTATEGASITDAARRATGLGVRK